MGHTTRIIPLVRELMAMNHTVIFAGDHWQTELAKKELPGIDTLYFPGFSIKYSRFLPQYIAILLHSPLFLYHAVREHILLGKIIRENKIDIVISDSRTGLWNKKIKSVLITHMIRIPLPAPFRFLENLSLPFSRALIKKFTYCFIPDFPGPLNLSGGLSHGFSLPPGTIYTGILSRFSGYRTDCEREKDIFCTAIMSGPSPQKEILTSLTLAALKKSGEPSVILTGNYPGESLVKKENNIQIISNLTGDEIIKYLERSKMIISRSGYTTVMELFSIGKSALLIPTPGQAEQEYLARYLSEKRWFPYLRQKHLRKYGSLNLHKFTLPEFPWEENRQLLKAALSRLLED